MGIQKHGVEMFKYSCAAGAMNKIVTQQMLCRETKKVSKYNYVHTLWHTLNIFPLLVYVQYFVSSILLYR